MAGPDKSPKKKMEYKGEAAEIVMLGKREKVTGWRGELFVAIIRYGAKENAKYDVLPDSNSPADIDDLPEVKTFENLGEAMTYAMELERSKKKWKPD